MTYISWSSDSVISWRLVDECCTGDIDLVWQENWPEAIYVAKEPIFHGPVILSCILKTIWWTHVIIGILDPCDAKIYLIKCMWVSDLHFMVQLFCLISWRLFDGWMFYWRYWFSATLTLTYKYMFKSVTYTICLVRQARRILDRVCFGLRLIHAPNKPAGYHSCSGTCRTKTISYQDILSHFFVRVISYHFSGHLVPSIIMGFNSLMLLFYVSKFTFYICYYTRKWLDQMHIGKFYHMSCNTVLCRHFNSVNPLCLFVCMYIHE